MVRAIWSGSVSFGLVNVPVKLVTAVQSKDIRFNQLHKEDGARIEQRKFCSVDGKEITNDDIVKGYEITPGRYVTISREEMEAAESEATRRIDIEDFVNLADIDPIYFDQPYYLVPDKGAGKAYGLLVEAMKRSGRVAIARVVLRSKEHLVALRTIGDALSMTMLVYHDEVVPQEKLEGIESVQPTDRELAMAEQLIGTLTADFDPTKYHDQYRERLLALIQRKADGEEIIVEPARAAAASPVDLVAALQASLANAKRKTDVEA